MRYTTRHTMKYTMRHTMRYTTGHTRRYTMRHSMIHNMRQHCKLIKEFRGTTSTQVRPTNNHELHRSIKMVVHLLQQSNIKPHSIKFFWKISSEQLP